MASHSSILAGITPWTERPGRLPTMESPRVRHDLATKLARVQSGPGQLVGARAVLSLTPRAHLIHPHPSCSPHPPVAANDNRAVSETSKPLLSSKVPSYLHHLLLAPQALLFCTDPLKTCHWNTVPSPAPVWALPAMPPFWPHLAHTLVQPTFPSLSSSSHHKPYHLLPRTRVRK